MIESTQTRGASGQKYTVYRILGSDHSGEIDIFRRFSDFDTFRNILIGRWPGIYIPSIPPKQQIKKTEAKLVKERHYFLDKFLKDCSTLPYIYESEEW